MRKEGLKKKHYYNDKKTIVSFITNIRENILFLIRSETYMFNSDLYKVCMSKTL